MHLFKLGLLSKYWPTNIQLYVWKSTYTTSICQKFLLRIFLRDQFERLN